MAKSDPDQTRVLPPMETLRQPAFWRSSVPLFPWLRKSSGKVRLLAAFPIHPGLVLALLAVQGVVFLKFPAYLTLSYLFWTMILGNCFLGVPSEPFLLLYGATWPPVLVAAVSATSAFTACFIDYWAVRSIFSFEKLKKIKESPLYSTLMSMFMKSPDAVVLISTATQLIPFTLVRVLGPTSTYPNLRYAAVVFLGRFIRFYALGRLVSEFGIFNTTVIIGGAALITGSFGWLARFVLQRCQRRRQAPLHRRVLSF